MSVEVINQFNEILDSFLIQLSPLIGTTYHYQIQQIIKYNRLLPIEQFLVHALPLRDKILNRDETYFINNDHQEVFGTEESTLNEILRMKNIYGKLDTVSRNNVWDIFQAMLILGEEYIRLNKHKFT
jgi:hypothetical protein